MTVKQLIESLSKIQDQNITVMVRGYEGGVDDIVIGNAIDNNTPAIVNVAINVNDEWYYGRHGVHNFDHEYKGREIINAIIL
jgi:hypothetical protein